VVCVWWWPTRVVLCFCFVLFRLGRASTNSRPPSRADSEASETSEPEIFTTVQQETKNIGVSYINCYVIFSSLAMALVFLILFLTRMSE
jgi:hypothetical protein